MTTLHDQYTPVFQVGFHSLNASLAKAAAHADARKLDPAVLLNTRLFPDMLPLTRQIQIASDTARRAVARWAGIEAPSIPDTETTIPGLQARIAATTAYIAGITPEQVADGAERIITLKFGSESISFTGQHYLDVFVVPNFHFHRAAAHCILRACGVELGKRDYLGPIGEFASESAPAG